MFRNMRVATDGSERSQCAIEATVSVAAETGVTVTSNATYRGIIDAAEQRGRDLIIMASHGLRGIGAILPGSEVQKVLTHTRIPVLAWRCGLFTFRRRAAAGARPSPPRAPRRAG